MQLKLVITPKNLLAIIALLFVCHEVHELIHTTVAYFQCGCWGQRDFNVWQVCINCSSATNTVWATLAGPLITYLLIWIGWLLMHRSRTIAQQSVGFALVWANVPFARLFTVLMKGGDESVITVAIAGRSAISIGVWLLEIAVVLLLVLPPLMRAWKILPSQKRSLIFIAFLIGPMLVEYITMHKLGNHLLLAGVLNSQGVLGSPVLVNIWNSVWLAVLLISFSKLSTFFQKQKKHTKVSEREMQNY